MKVSLPPSNLRSSQQTNVNPVKRLGILPNSSSTPSKSSGCIATFGGEPVFYSDFAMPLTFEQEKKYLELGINESLIKVFLIDSETH
ncbi:hypothetical protein P5673_033193 [Acropora cervicornis]|uniref:Uncharacterized protein n=1 Tax=Acropora cervicornis TaxID=6130 RepID=A0AAD9PQC6_ACRCE|nr:hypothetical protein P5673_033193 [Acropora cervicornis]